MTQTTIFQRAISYLSILSLAVMIAACGGGSPHSPSKNSSSVSSSKSASSLQTASSSISSSDPAVVLSVVASEYATIVNGNAITLTTVTKKNASDVVQWSLSIDSKGSLDTATGDVVHYTPPSSTELLVDANEVVIATVGDQSYQTIIGIHQKPFFVFKGQLRGISYVDGNGTEAIFNHIYSLAIDKSDNLLVNDTSFDDFSLLTAGNNAIRKVTSAGNVSTIYDLEAMGLQSGVGQLVLDQSDNLYASYDTTKIIKFLPDKTYVAIAGGTKGTSDGIGVNARFNNIAGFIVDPLGSIFVTDPPTIRKIDSSNLVTTIAGKVGEPGYYDTQGLQARFDSPSGITRDSSGNLFVYDSGLVRKIDPSVNVSTFYNANLSGTNDYGALAIDLSDNLFVAPQTKTLTKFSSTAVRTDFPSVRATSNTLAVDSQGNVFFAGDHKIQKMTPAGEVSVFVGRNFAESSSQDMLFYLADSFPPSHTLTLANAMASDKAGNLYIALTGYFTDRMGGYYGLPRGYTFYKISPDGVYKRLPPYEQDTDYLHAYNISGMAVDDFGNKYITQNQGYNTRVGLVAKVSPNGNYEVVAGNDNYHDGSSVDGVGASALFDNPQGLTLDSVGNIFVIEGEQNGRIRKISPSHAVTTLVSNLEFDTCRSYRNLVLDKLNNLYFIDGCRIVKKLSPSGEITILAGGTQAGAVDGIGANASFDQLSGLLSIDADDNLYVLDEARNTIRKITSVGEVTTVVGVSGSRGFQFGDLPGRIGRTSWLDSGYVVGPETMTMLGGHTLIFTRSANFLGVVLPH